MATPKPYSTKSLSPPRMAQKGRSQSCYGTNDAPEFTSTGDVLSTGFAHYGVDEFDQVGLRVPAPEDVNGDGYVDLIIGAPEVIPIANPDAGESYVVFGQAGGFDTSFDLSQA